jgi:two-component system sensor histidine kinase TctE
MKAPGRSLYTRLALRIGLVLLISGLALVTAIVLSTRMAARDVYDRLLIGSALQVAEHTWYENGEVNVDAPISALSMLTPGDQVFYAVIGPTGRVVAGDTEFRPPIPWKQLGNGPVVVQGSYQGLPVSIVFVGRRMPVTGANPWAVVMLAHTNNARNSFADKLGRNTTVLVVAAGVLTLLAALFTLYQALAPLKQIVAEIGQRDLNELAPFTEEVPTEIHPLVASLNDFVERLAQHRAVMRRVIGDAAHQLRTPVAALLSQMEMLSMERGQAASDRHLARLGELTRHLGELVNQLINHAMVQHRAGSVPLQEIDLARLARDEMADMLSHHANRMLDLAFSAPDAPCPVMGDPVTLREAVRNVLANALEYGAPALLHIEIARVGADWELLIVDDGPGIPAADQERIRKPFAARSGNRPGASLGLSIVEEVMRAHHGHLRFARTAQGYFAVVLGIPAAPTKAPPGQPIQG